MSSPLGACRKSGARAGNCSRSTSSACINLMLQMPEGPGLAQLTAPAPPPLAYWSLPSQALRAFTVCGPFRTFARRTTKPSRKHRNYLCREVSCLFFLAKPLLVALQCLARALHNLCLALSEFVTLKGPIGPATTPLWRVSDKSCCAGSK